jgi:thiamine transport system permease protein
MRNNPLSFALIFLFVSPFILLIPFIKNLENPFTSDFFSVLGLSFLQASLSAVAILIFGFFAALGLVRTANRLRKVLDIILLWPSFVPVLLVLVATLNASMAFARFPFGFWGVVILHVAINSGLIAVMIARLLESQAGAIIEVATIEGASKWLIIRVVARELILEIANLFFFLFVLCFTSFSVPLIVGAQSGRTLETLIYEKLVASHQAGAALSLSVIQIIFLLVFSSRFAAVTNTSTNTVFRHIRKISFLPALFAVVLLSLLLIYGATHGFVLGLNQIRDNQNLISRLSLGMVGTAFESLFVSLLTLSLCFAECLNYIENPDGSSSKFFKSFAAPSAAVVGLALVITFSPETWSNLSLTLLISCGFTLLVFSTLYRLRIASALSALRPQFETARVLGASRLMILKSVAAPALRKDLAFVAGIAAFWASGDFAFGSMVAGRDITLAIGAHSLLGGYRLEAATAVTIFSLFVGALFFLAFDWFGSSPEVKT